MSELSKLRLTVFPNGIASFLVDTNAEIKTANYTVVVNDDSGKTLVSTLDGIVYTLPSIAIMQEQRLMIKTSLTLKPRLKKATM